MDFMNLKKIFITTFLLLVVLIAGTTQVHAADCTTICQNSPDIPTCVKACVASGNKINTGGITNPAISPTLGSNPDEANAGTTFARYFIIIWQGLIVIGTLAMLFNLVNGALEWITAGGEQAKVQHARQKMTNAIVGLVILVGSFAIVIYIGVIFHFDNLLQIQVPTP